MFILRFFRVVITVVLVIALLAVGTISIFIFSVSNAVLKSTYFSEDLVEADTYSFIYNYGLDSYVPPADGDNSGGIGGNAAYTRIMYDELPYILSDVVSVYLADWMSYMLEEVPESEIPLLNIEDSKDKLFDSIKSLTNDEEFMLELVKERLESEGQNPKDYDESQLREMITTMDIETIYLDSFDKMISNPDSLYYKTAVGKDPVAFLKYAMPDMTEDELLMKVHELYGILKYYKSIANLFYAGILACVGLIFILWINKLKVPLTLNGIIMIITALPVFILSSSERVFNALIHILGNYVPEGLPDIAEYNLFVSPAITPITGSMMIASSIVIGLGVVFIILGAVIKNKKKDESEAIEAA